MCWIPLTLGALMVALGAGLIVRFFFSKAQGSIEVASTARTESMVVGVALVSIGFLVLVLGVTGVICGFGGWA
jgi:hypothetical protein